MNEQRELISENQQLIYENRELFKKKESLKASLKSYKNKLRIAEASIDFQFKKIAENYIKEQVLPRAARVKATDYSGDYIEKKYNRNFEPFKGMTPFQLFHLELDCLGRLNEITQEYENNHFPKLIDFDANSLIMKFSNNGQSLNNLKSTIKVPQIKKQLDYIFLCLEKARVVHLDMHPAGTNISVSTEGVVSIIDFDLAKVNDFSFNYTIDEILQSDKIVTTRERVLEILKGNKYIELV